MSLKENINENIKKENIDWPLEKIITPDELLKRAREASNFAYAPYSHFHVGSAMIFEDGEIITGCNVENASFGLSVCAERVAVFNMVSRGRKNPAAIAVAGSIDNKDDYFKIPCPPCGACRQTLMEFAPDMLVVLASSEGAKIYRLNELLPLSFSL